MRAQSLVAAAGHIPDPAAGFVPQILWVGNSDLRAVKSSVTAGHLRLIACPVSPKLVTVRDAVLTRSMIRLAWNPETPVPQDGTTRDVLR